MRKILLITVFIATTLVARGQVNVGYISFAPGDNGIGLRVDINHIYTSMTYGNYWMPYGGYIKDHARVSMGMIYRDFSLGLSYHHYGEVKETLPLNKATFYPVSVELGARVFIKRFACAIRYDVLRGEGTVDFGIVF
jgi:hypothetical protein